MPKTASKKKTAKKPVKQTAGNPGPKPTEQAKPGDGTPKTPVQYTVSDIIEKRKRIWEEKHDLEYDKALVSAAVTKILSEDALRDEIREKPYLLIEVAFYIVNKKSQTVPFFLNDVQRDFIHQLETLGTSKPYFVLKGRQQGFTSLITAIQLCFVIVRKDFNGFTVADRSDNTRAIFNDKARTVYERLPNLLKPHEKFNSVNEMFFDKLNSSWRAATASKDIARSRTLNFVHFSEVAFYECALSDMQAGIGEAIAAGAIIVYESTANGFNQAKDLWDSGSCNNLFYEWWRSPEYRSTEYQYLDNMDAWLTERVKVLTEAGCDREQITWYAKKYASYLDKNTIKQEYPITPEEAFISSGDCVFDKEIIANRIVSLKDEKPVKRGYFRYRKETIPVTDSSGIACDVEWRIKDIEFIRTRDGYITIHEEPRTVTDKDGVVLKKAPYAIGGDTAGTGIDYFTAKVVCGLDDHAVATLHKQNMDDDLYAEQMYCLGKYYHDAMIGIEINYSRQPMRVLQKYNYPNLYMRERLTGMTDKPVLEYGFETTSRTKPIIIGELVGLMREDAEIECDLDTLREMLSFVRKENGKMEADTGAHDDLVMATAIAHFVAKQQTHEWIESAPVKINWIEEHFHTAEAFGTGGNSDFMSWEDY